MGCNAMRKLDVIRHDLTYPLRIGRSTVVGALVYDLNNPFWGEILRGATDRLAEDGCTLMVCSTNARPETEARHLRMLEGQGVRGIIAVPARSDARELAAVHDRGTPTVLFDQSNEDLCSVAADDVRGGELAASHIIEMGHRRIAFLNGPAYLRPCADRRTGVLRAFRRAGLDPDTHLTIIPIMEPGAANGERILDGLLDRDHPPTAVICDSDVLALGVLRGLRRRDMVCPRDLAVVGYDDVEFAAELSTPLTSVQQPAYHMGRAAAELLMAEDECAANGTDTTAHPHEHRQIRFRPHLIIRASSAPPELIL